MLAKWLPVRISDERPAWLVNARAKLDAAVTEAYGWPADLKGEEILERLLALNLERAAAEAKSASARRSEARARSEKTSSSEAQRTRSSAAGRARDDLLRLEAVIIPPDHHVATSEHTTAGGDVGPVRGADRCNVRSY